MGSHASCHIPRVTSGQPRKREGEGTCWSRDTQRPNGNARRSLSANEKPVDAILPVLQKPASQLQRLIFTRIESFESYLTNITRCRSSGRVYNAVGSPAGRTKAFKGPNGPRTSRCDCDTCGMKDLKARTGTPFHPHHHYFI